MIVGTVVNSDSQKATYPVKLLVNGSLQETAEVTVGARAQQAVTFRYAPQGPGKYVIKVGAQTAELTALQPATFAVNCLTVKPERVRAGSR
ncbi:MAG: hypothetical protein EXR47_07645 [Dehalococcoidia bacterium]|nr:hypothetical protein [Dehalococcoidia bacterium]